jgi:hypothetical protein
MKFRRKFGTFQQCAYSEPVEITPHGRRAFVLMLAQHYNWMRAAARHTHRTSYATAVVIDAMERAEMDLEHAARDELLK